MTNFEKTKLIIRALSRYKLTGCEYAVCLYLIDELYGYTGTKQVESSSYQHISTVIGFSPIRIKRSVKLLLLKNIIIKQPYATKYGNSYKFIHPDNWRKLVSYKIPLSVLEDTASSILEDTQP
jgi:hypothetical protein